MVTKDSNPLPTKSQTTSSDTNERGSNTTATSPKTTPSADQGLSDLPVSPTKELGKKQEVLQKAQLESKSAVKEVKEKTPPSPATRMHRYALKVWIKVGSIRAGLMVEQSTEACKLISSIPIWMGYVAKIKARVISLQEANDMIVGLKRLDKEDLKKACMDLHHWLSSWRLGNTGSNLSAMAQPFVPLATSSNTAVRPLGAVNAPAPMPLPPPADPVTHPLYTSEDEGATTEVVTPKKKNCNRCSRGTWSKRGSQTETCDSGSEATGFSSSTGVSDSLMGRRRNKKKGGVNNKVHIPEFDGKTSKTEGGVRPSVDGLKASPIIGIIMRTNTSWLRSLGL